MPLPDAIITIYCDEPSHAPEPMGPFIAGSALEAWERLRGVEGVFVVAAMEFGTERTNLWTPAEMVISPTGLRYPRRMWFVRTDEEASPERIAEFAEVGLDREAAAVRYRYRLKCEWCGLSLVRRAPVLQSRMDALAGNGISGISLKSLIDTG